MGKVVVVTSGKGGVGKTTSSASIAMGLAMRGLRTVVIDFDVGLRNLDIITGCERRVVYDLVNVLQGEAHVGQALIKDKHCENLWILAASQTRDKEVLDLKALGKVMQELRGTFDYIICDSPAGIEKGSIAALYYADEAVIVTNPEVSSIRDSDRILGVMQSKSHRAIMGEEPIKERLLITRYDPDRVERGEMLSIDDVHDILAIPMVGVIPERREVLRYSNLGKPVILNKGSVAAEAYEDTVSRFLGEWVNLRFTKPERKGFFSRLIGV